MSASKFFARTPISDTSATTVHICGHCREIKVNEFTTLFNRRQKDCPAVNLDSNIVKHLASMSKDEQSVWNEHQELANVCVVAPSLPLPPANHQTDLDASAGEPMEREPAAINPVECVSVGIQTRSASRLRILKRQLQNNASAQKLRQGLTAASMKHLRGKINFLRGRLALEIRRRRRAEDKRSTPSSNYWRCHVDLPTQTDSVKTLIFECDGELNSLTIRQGVRH